MGNFVVISKDIHKEKYWRKPENLKYFENQTVFPILITEIGRAVNSFPLSFIKHEDNYIFVAILGLVPGENLFLSKDGKWMGNYIPALMRAYPFRLIKGKEERMVLAIDNDFITEKKEDVPFFEGENLSKHTEEILRFLTEIERARILTVNACKILSKLELIEPWNLIIKTNNGDRKVEGLFKINEQKLLSLSDEEFLSLRKTGALQLAYGQLFSMGNLYILGRLAQMKYEGLQRLKPEPEKSDTFIDDIDVEELFKNLKFPDH
ncbi:MAG: SapC family protein [candidate division WOR-3 bacterium]